MMNKRERSRFKTTLWIVFGVSAVLILAWSCFNLIEMNEIANVSSASNQVLTANRALAELDQWRARSPESPLVVGVHPELSWRVAILPLLGEEEHVKLYNEFHLDEPWDSPHNKRLIPRMPLDYELIRGVLGPKLAAGMTCLVMPVEAEATNELFARPAAKSPEAFSKLLERVGSVGRVVEAPPELATPWTKPDELSISDPRIVAFRTRLLVGYVDGTVGSLPADQVTPAKLDALFAPPPATQAVVGDQQ